MNETPHIALMDTLEEPKRFRPDNTPNLSRHKARMGAPGKKPTQGTKGAFGKAKNLPKDYVLKAALSRLGRKAWIQLNVQGFLSEPTREELNAIAPGLADTVLEKLTMRKRLLAAQKAATVKETA